MRDSVFYICSTVFSGIFTALVLMFLLRSVMSLFTVPEENRLLAFVFDITEFFITPVRVLFERFRIAENSVIDFPALTTMLICVVLSSVL